MSWRPPCIPLHLGQSSGVTSYVRASSRHERRFHAGALPPLERGLIPHPRFSRNRTVTTPVPACQSASPRWFPQLVSLLYAPLRRHPYVAGLCHVTMETPHHRTLSAPDKQRLCDSCNLVGNGGSLFLLSPSLGGKPLIGNYMPRVRGADSPGGCAYR
jgi:hypothetical protein